MLAEQTSHGSIPGIGKFFHFSKPSAPHLKPSHTQLIGYYRLKQPGRETDNSPLPSTEVMND